MRPHEWIADRLKDRGKTQADLARHLHISRPAMNNIISGTRAVQGDEMEPMAAFLEMDIREFLKSLDAKKRVTAQSSGPGDSNAPDKTRAAGSRSEKNSGDNMSDIEVMAIRSRIKQMLSRFDATTAATLVDEIVLEMAVEEARRSNPRKRA